MNIAINMWESARDGLRGWSWMKRSLFIVCVVGFLISSFLFLTEPGLKIRKWMAETVITTQHRSWAWMFVGAQMRDEMVQLLQDTTDAMGQGHVDLSRIKITKQGSKKNRTLDELLKVEDISGPTWKGKKMTVYDPTTIRVVVPNKQGEGERITDMVKRTGAVAGVNGGAFYDPDGLGNGFAPIGFIMSGGEVIFTEHEGSVPQHSIGFTKEGKLVVGLYSIDELQKQGVQEAVFWKPRIIADGKPLITQGDGGWGIGPRTAVGQKADGTLIFIVIDGRQPPYSLGATLREVQDIFLEDEVENAGFLDGGASSEMVVDGQLITKPASRYGERRLPSALLIFDHPEEYDADHIWDGLKKIDAGGAKTHPEFLKEQEELRQKGLLNPTPKATPSSTPTKKPESTATHQGGGDTGKPSGTPNQTETPNISATPSSKPSGETGGTTKPPSSSATPGTSTSPGTGGTPTASAKPAETNGTSTSPSGTPHSSASATVKPSTGASTQTTAPSGQAAGGQGQTQTPQNQTAKPN
ncbi:phosphodiester glycosidase family protein [Paenibacillus sp. MBLB4367]|uniref:phosphodiester glycosidase family protein n=1 Tax=Paenibacillus sp. MBLB4367 TaxID=3384767 RepID=UPI00390815F5